MGYTEGFSFTNKSASFGVTLLLGGRYMVDVVATWGGGSVKLQKLAADGSTYVDIVAAYDVSAAEQDEPINSWGANEAKLLDLSPGRYQFTVTTATAVYASIVRVPLT